MVVAGQNWQWNSGLCQPAQRRQQLLPTTLFRPVRNVEPRRAGVVVAGTNNNYPRVIHNGANLPKRAMFLPVRSIARSLFRMLRNIGRTARRSHASNVGELVAYKCEKNVLNLQCNRIGRILFYNPVLKNMNNRLPKKVLLVLLLVALPVQLLAQGSYVAATATAESLADPAQYSNDWRANGPPGGDVRSLVVDPANPDRFYLGTLDGQIYTSADGGKTWELLYNFNKPKLFVESIIVDPRDPRTIYVAAHRHKDAGG